MPLAKSDRLQCWPEVPPVRAGVGPHTKNRALRGAEYYSVWVDPPGRYARCICKSVTSTLLGH